MQVLLGNEKSFGKWAKTVLGYSYCAFNLHYYWLSYFRINDCTCTYKKKLSNQKEIIEKSMRLERTKRSFTKKKERNVL